jgi:hypothetical protein
MDRTGRIALKIFTNSISVDTRQAIYDRLNDVPLAMEETGEIHKQNAGHI